MMNVLLVLAAMGIVLGLAELLLRLTRLNRIPLRYRLFYSFYLMSRESEDELYVLNQRIMRGGFSNVEELIRHYHLISGRSFEEVRSVLLPPITEVLFFSRMYSSGVHAVYRQKYKGFVGPVPAENQKLRSLKVNSAGLRGDEIKTDENSVVVSVLGGSVAFGLGAMAEEGSFCGRLQAHLRELSGNPNYHVVNHAGLGFNSFQEFTSLRTSSVTPDIVVSLTGWNEMGQAIMSGKEGASALINAAVMPRSLGARFLLRHFVLDRILLYKVYESFRRVLGYTKHVLVEDKVDEVAAENGSDKLYPLY